MLTATVSKTPTSLGVIWDQILMLMNLMPIKPLTLMPMIRTALLTKTTCPETNLGDLTDLDGCSSDQLTDKADASDGEKDSAAKRY